MARFGFGKNKGGNTGGKDYDVMNPEAVNPNAKKAGQQLGKLAKKLAKAIGKLIKKLFQLLLKLGWVGIIIILIIIIILVIVAFQHMPGMMKDKLLSLFKIDPSKWFANGAVSSLDEDYQDIIDVANYLEQMDYNLIGDGFVRPKLRTGNDDIFTQSETQDKHPEYEYWIDNDGVGHFYNGDNIVQNLKYYDSLGRTIDNATGEPVSDDTYIDEYGIERSMEETNGMEGDSSDSRGKVVNIEKEDLKNYKLIRTYLLSNYRIYTLRNSDEDMLTKIYNAILTIAGNDDAWAKGLIKLYNAEGGIATDHWWWGRGLLGETVSLNDTTLSLKKGWFNNAMNFSIEGWAPRYGMSLEFLLSIHLGTGAPDLTTAMLQNFDTEVQVYLDDSGKAHVDSRYVDPSESGIGPLNGDSIEKVKAVLSAYDDDIAASVINDKAALEWVDSIALDKENCQHLLRSKEEYGPDGKNQPELALTLESPPTCTRTGQTYLIEESSKDPAERFLFIPFNVNDLDVTYSIGSYAEPDLYNIEDNYPDTYTVDGNKFDFSQTIQELTDDAQKQEAIDNENFSLFDIEEVKSKYGYDPQKEQNGEGTFDVEVSDDYKYAVPDYQEENGKTVWYRNERADIMGYYNEDEGVLAEGWTSDGKTLYQIQDVTKYRKVVNKHEWMAPAPNSTELVGYEWVSYKYIIDGIYSAQVHSVNCETSEDNPGFKAITEWSEPTIIEGIDPVLEGPTVYILEFIRRDKTEQELIDDEILQDLDGDGEYESMVPEESRCSHDETLPKCCSNCQKYVRAVVSALAAVSDQDYRAYTPYIARVVGSWFRDTYFIVPQYPDVAISEYAGKIAISSRQKDEDGNGLDISSAAQGDDDRFDDEVETVVRSVNRPEFNYANTFGDNATYVEVDKTYMEDTGEYWTAYDMKDDNEEEYQLYVLNGDGTTSNVTLEDFLENGFTYNGQQLVAPGQFKDKDEAEAAGWAFVKKAKTMVFTNNIAGAGDRINSNVLWSAYGFDSNGSSTEWIKVKQEDKNDKVNNLYDIIYGEGSDGDEDSGIFYQLVKTNNVTQTEDAQRGETNPLVKYLFKYRKFYIYDGGETRGLAIEHDKQRVLYGYNYYCDQQYDYNNEFYNEKVIADPDSFKEEGYEDYITDDNFYHFIGLLDYNGQEGLLHKIYGATWKTTVKNKLNKYGRSAIRETYSDTFSSIVPVGGLLTAVGVEAASAILIDEENLASQWLDWQLDMLYMHRFGVDINQYYHAGGEELLVLDFDPRDPDLIGTVQITKSSLSVFSILENAGTLDADYAYRDFKELIVELDYFDKEELSDKIPAIFTWVLPDHDPPIGWPVRPFDKADVDYGTMIHSKATYDALEAYTTGKTLDELTSIEQTGTGDPQTGTTESQTGTTEPQAGTTEPQTGGDSEPQNSSSKKIDSSKIFWIGDSWIVGLGASGKADSPAGSSAGGQITSDYFFCKVGVNADWVLNNYSTMSIPSDASAIVVEFGLNGVTNWPKTQELINKLKTDHSNIEVFVLQTSHICSGYPFSTPSNSQIDTYNENMKNYADSKDGVTYIDPTGSIQGSDGCLKNEYAQNPNDNSQGGGKIHLNADGYGAWYQAIIEAMGNTSAATKLEKFEGYEAGELVSSPVTGKILEVGKHQRMNLYTQQMEEVEYIIIEVMNSENYFKPEMFEGYDYTTTSTKYETPEKALNLFFDEYDNVCAGYTIMIDGIDVDLSLTSADAGVDEEPTDPATEPEPSTDPQGGDDENQNSINGSFKKREEEDLRGFALYNSDEWNNLIDEEQAKEDAPCFINYGETKAYPTPEDNYKAEDGLVGYYVKEGKFIGKTIENEVVETRTPTADPEPEPDPEPTAEPNPDNPTSDSENTEKLTYTYYDYTGPADYIRIIIKDLDYAIVDNVEDFFNIPEQGTSSASTDLDMEKFLYWMGVYVEGGHLDSSGTKSVPVDLNDGAGWTHYFGITSYNKALAQKLGYNLNWADNIDLKILVDLYLALIDEETEYIKSELGEDIPDGYLQAFISIKHNYGNLTKRGREYKANGEVSESTWTTYEGTQYAEALTKRRKSEWLIISEGRYTKCYEDYNSDLEFTSDTPFTDWCKEHGITITSN